MATDYPIEIDDVGGGVRIGGIANFTDPDNQPSGPTVQFPFKPAPGDDVTVLEDSSGNPLISGGDDTGGVRLRSPDAGSSVRVTDSGTKLAGDVGFFDGSPVAQPTGDLAAALSTLGLVDSPVLGASTVYVTVQAAAPTTYQTPIVVDTTAVTGATYAWDGSAYQEIANLIT